MLFLENFFFYIFSPLDQFEVRDYVSLKLVILNNLYISLTNIGFYITIGCLIVLILILLANNFFKFISNN